MAKVLSRSERIASSRRYIALNVVTENAFNPTQKRDEKGRWVKIPYYKGSGKSGVVSFQLSEKAQKALEDNEWIWSNDLMTAIDGKRKLAIGSDTMASRAKLKSKINGLKKFIKKNGFKAEVIEGKFPIYWVISKTVSHSDEPSLRKLLKKYTGLFETSQKENQLLGEAFGYPAKAIEAFYRDKVLSTNSLITNARKKPINPLRSDPSRTTTIRRGFEEQLLKRFSRLQKEITKLLVDDKALGITENAFCPTGPGGGIDNSCSPQKSKVHRLEIKGEIVHIYENQSKEQIARIFKNQNPNNPYYNELRGMVLGGKAYIWEPTTETGNELTHDLIGAKLLGEPNPPANSRFWVSDKDEWGRKTELYISAKYGKQESPEVDAWASSIGMTANVFCPTGPGGGVDPTCGNDDLQRITEAFDRMPFGDNPKDYRIKTVKLTSLNNLVKSKKVQPIIQAQEEGVQAKVQSGRLGTIIISRIGKKNWIVDGNHSYEAAKRLKKKEVVVVYPKKFRLTLNELTTNAPNWSFDTPQSKIDNFEKWIISKLSETMDEKDIHSGINWWQLYIERAYKLGAGRTFDEVRKRGAVKKPEWYQGTKEQFLSSSFNNPVSVDRLKVLVGRTHKALKGLTDLMRTQLTQELTDGLIQGKSPKEIAKNISKRLGISKNRGLAIARTETVRAHAEGQLASLRALGVNEIGVDVEFTTARNPCPICNKLKGKVFTLDQAEGLIPRHPNCLCAFLPRVSSKPSPQKEYRRKSIESSILSITRKSPLIGNVFCPTGKGGGVDPTCGKTESNPNSGSHFGVGKYAETKYKARDKKITARRKKVMQKAAEIIAAQDVYIALSSSALTKVLKEGRFKNTHETKTSNGLNDQNKRLKFEMNYCSASPIYGFMSSNGSTGKLSTYYPDKGESYVADGAHQYGNARVKLKSSLRDRTTFTGEDSLDYNGHSMTREDWEYPPAFIPSPVNKPSYKSLPSDFTEGYYKEVQSSHRYGYSEAQIHGTVRVEDIEKVVFYEPVTKVLRSKLIKLGIPFEERKYGRPS